MNAENVRLGILVGGGPAPGINSAISACTLEAISSGAEVYGILDGFSHLMAGQIPTHVIPIDAVRMWRSSTPEGERSILRTSRANPTRNPNHLRNVRRTRCEKSRHYSPCCP